ncbi:MAG TPA: WGR domain-containing protein, partial [Nannocystaceae bacterium]|nr:WGR domain-containing protein [Nannocystaceae bacterium]
MKLVQRIQLGLVEGTSDKVYIVELCEVGSGRFVVNFQFGRRGKPLQSGTKTESPVNLRQAQSIYERLVDEKKRKGYS